MSDQNSDNSSQQIPQQAYERAIQVLEQIADDRGILAEIPVETRRRLLAAAGKVSHPGRLARRQMTHALRVQRRADLRRQKESDEQALANTGLRRKARAHYQHFANPPAPFEPFLPSPLHLSDAPIKTRLQQPRNCYICKENFDSLHHFYDSLCPPCAELNWQKRNQTAELHGRFALVTGGRVKIGYEAALKLLRAGAHVIVTTRFPCDAATRFANQHDSSVWLPRLQLFGLDLRHTPSIERFADHLVDELPQLDFILNNACQTVRRPPGFYTHLMEAERALTAGLPPHLRPLLTMQQSLAESDPSHTPNVLPAEVAGSLAGVHRSAELSQIPLLEDDQIPVDQIFPAGHYDENAQQVDLRSKNSWRLQLHEVPTAELLEVHLVNAVAPFVLNARLKPLMQGPSDTGRHIVNVSAMEGVFYRAFKTDKHPHTNMAKAALNMMTRTSAGDYIRDGIHMNSVDTGWITDEDPIEITLRKQQEQGFHPPLDTIDAAARICDPFFYGLNTGQHLWGKFFKDYKVSNW